MNTYTVTIVTRYALEIGDLESYRKQITDNYEPAQLPSFLGEENVEFLDGSITYE
jgi:hypothetical protein